MYENEIWLDLKVRCEKCENPINGHCNAISTARKLRIRGWCFRCSIYTISEETLTEILQRMKKGG